MGKNLVAAAQQQQATYGIYLTVADPAMVELAAYAGFDFIRVDCEHMLMDYSAIANLVRAGNAAGVTMLVRINSLADVTRMLDYGVDGFIVPGIKTRAEAQQAVELIKYAPLGMRGMMPNARCVRYGVDSFKEYLRTANERVSFTIQLESKEALENIDEILSVEGIDMAASGKMDLSQALGVPGQNSHPQVIAAEDLIVKKAVQYGKQPTMLVANPQRAQALRTMGVYCMTVCYDSDFIYHAFRNYLATYQV